MPIQGVDSRGNMSFAYTMALTGGIGGLQVIWSVLQANGTTHLLSLGMSEFWASSVWLLAPLCGIIVHPVMGVLSDRCQSPLGKRRPFIIGGMLGAVISMLLVAWSEDIVATFFLGAGQGQGENDGSKSRTFMTVSLASASVLVLYICIQPMQMGMRALIVDRVPHNRQALANTITSCWVGVGNMIGHIAGSIDFGGQFNLDRYQYLSLISCASLATTVAVCCIFANENQSDTAGATSTPRSIKPAAIIGNILSSYNQTSGRIRKVFQVQFFVWMAWFPFLFYGSTYVAESYTASLLIPAFHTQDLGTSHTDSESLAQARILNRQGARLGSLAYLAFSIVGFISNLTLSLISPSRGANPRSTLEQYGIFWTCCHVLHAVCLILIPSPQSWVGSATLITYAGVPWAMTQWLPYAIIGEELAYDDITGSPDSDSDDGLEEEEKGGEPQYEPKMNIGTIMGLHNVIISAPQVIAALLSSVILWVLANQDDQYGIGWVLRAGALPALVAAFLAAATYNG